MATGLLNILILLLVSSHCQSCRHVGHAMECFQPVLQTSEHELEENELLILKGQVNHVYTLCKNYFTAQGCLKDSIRQCRGLKDSARENLKVYVESVVRRGVYRLCDDISLIHKFSKYSRCFRKTRNSTGACLLESRRQFSANGMSLRASSLDELSRRHCRTMEDLMSCGYSSVSRKCGHSPAMVYLDIMQRLLPQRAVDICIDSYIPRASGFHGYDHVAAVTEPPPSSGSAPVIQQLYLGVIGATIGMATILFSIFCMP